MRFSRMVVVCTLSVACRAREPAAQAPPAAANRPDAARSAPADVLTVVVNNDRGAKPEELVPEPEPEPEAKPDAAAAPRSDVKLILRVVPADAEVWWGAKRLGIAKRGEPFEIVRPRHSGPVDLLLKASGFLPYHTRLFSDREEKLTVDLVRPDEARSLNGWKPPEMPKPKANPAKAAAARGAARSR